MFRFDPIFSRPRRSFSSHEQYHSEDGGEVLTSRSHWSRRGDPNGEAVEPSRLPARRLERSHFLHERGAELNSFTASPANISYHVIDDLPSSPRRSRSLDARSVSSRKPRDDSVLDLGASSPSSLRRSPIVNRGRDPLERLVDVQQFWTQESTEYNSNGRKGTPWAGGTEPFERGRERLPAASFAHQGGSERMQQLRAQLQAFTPPSRHAAYEGPYVLNRARVPEPIPVPRTNFGADRSQDGGEVPSAPNSDPAGQANVADEATTKFQHLSGTRTAAPAGPEASSASKQETPPMKPPQPIIPQPKPRWRSRSVSSASTNNLQRHSAVPPTKKEPEGPTLRRSAQSYLPISGHPERLSRSRSAEPTTHERNAAVVDVESNFRGARERSMRSVDNGRSDLAHSSISVSASNRLEKERQNMEAALRRHDIEFDRAMKLKEMERRQRQYEDGQRVKFEVVSGFQSAARNADKQSAEARSKELDIQRQQERLANEESRRLVRERHEEIVKQKRDGLLGHQTQEEARLRQRKKEMEEERQRRKAAANEKAEYIRQLNEYNQEVIQYRAQRLSLDMSMRQHEKAKQNRLKQIRERTREMNELKEERHKAARQQQHREVEELRGIQQAQALEQALVEREIERMRQIVREDRRHLDRALEQLRGER